jgi:nucleoside-diphosphate-sugar epimerase
MKVLVTGAAGKLGSEVCAHLLAHGYDLLATDRRHRPGLPMRLELADLCDDIAVYALLADCDAVVHLGNHPNLHAAASPQRLLSENTAMNANVFRAAVDRGISHIVFASSVQAMIKIENGTRVEEPYPIPYLPLDGAAPANPGMNFYGLSKEFAERLLQQSCAARPELRATSLRFPGLVNQAWLDRVAAGGRPAPRASFNFGELLAYLTFADGAAFIRGVLERQAPGYHQYYPAQCLNVRGLPLAALVAQHYPHVPLRQPLERLESLVDISALTHDLGWEPTRSTSVTFAD